jgi:RNA polymerase sigma-70 factor (ECF subfamily)
MATAAHRERELVDRARRGDARAFDLLVREHQDAVYRLCVRHAGTSGAEDLAQETFLRAFVHRAALDPQQSVRSWLLSVAHRLCIDRFRTQREFSEVDEGVHAAPQVDPDARIDARASLSRLEAAMAALPAGRPSRCIIWKGWSTPMWPGPWKCPSERS